MPDAQIIWLCEGESDTICALSQGLEAVCQTGGAGTWKPGFSSWFVNRHVVIAYDADRAGWEGALKAASALARVAASVRVVRWPDFMLPEDAPEDGEYWERLPENHGQDLTDFFARHQKTVEDLLDLLADAYQPKPPAPRDEGSDQAGDLTRFKAWSELDGKVAFRPILLVREILAEHRIVTERSSGITYIYDAGLGVWRPAPLDVVKRLVMDKMGVAASRNRVGEAAEMIQTLSLLPEGEDMDREPYLVNVQNGMVDLRSWEVLPHDPDYRSTYQHPWTFDPRRPVDCPRFKASLFKTVQVPEVIREVQEFMGYCLLRAYPYHKALFLVGQGNDGKSTFLAVLQDLVGKERCAAINLRDLEDQFLRVMLHRAALNVFTEASADFFRSDHFKALTGGDPITAAYKHQQPFRFESTCKHAFSMNSLPRMSDKSHALYRRILPVKFRHRFGPGDEDPAAKDKLRAELPGIFQFALVGLRRLLDRGGFRLSPTSQAVLAEYRDLNDVLRLFVDERCVVGEDKQVSKQDLYDAYKAWHEDAGLKTRLDKPRFFRELRSMDGLSITERRLTIGDGRTRVIEGLGLS